LLIASLIISSITPPIFYYSRVINTKTFKNRALILCFMGLPQLEYRTSTWDVVLPSIRAYSYSQEDIDAFYHNPQFPLAFDTNISNPCNRFCQYCVTGGGSIKDPRFEHPADVPTLGDKDISNMISQLSKLGARSFFLCSNGEPLLDRRRFLKIIDGIGYRGNINLITYTNGTTLSKEFVRELHQRDVNLVMKLESLDPRRNDRLTGNWQVASPVRRYQYGTLEGQQVPVGIINAFEEYGGDSDCLGVETMILNDNLAELLDIRAWAYTRLGVSQFLKHGYPIDYQGLGRGQVLPDEESKRRISQEIIDFDHEFGFVYPTADQTAEPYSFDVRRFMNNFFAVNEFPFRIFAFEVGGTYHSGDFTRIKFGFGTDNVVTVFDSDGNINTADYFRRILQILGQK